MSLKIKIFVIITFIIIAAIYVWYFFCGTETVGLEVERKDAVKAVTVTGTVVSSEDIDVTTEITGIIEKLYVGTNDFVEKGQILATLDNDEAVSDVKAAMARLSQMKFQLRKTKLEYEDANLDEERYEELFGVGAVSKREVEERQLRTKRLAEQIQENIRQIEASQAELSAAKSRLEDHIIRAPVSGYITDKFVSTGSVVSPQQPAYRLVAPEDIYLRAEVEENEIDLVRTGQTALVIFDAYPEKVFNQEVYLVTREVNPLTGTFEARITKPEEENVQVLVGMTFDSNIILNKVDDVIIIPADFIREENNRMFVFKLKGSFAEKVEIEAVSFDNNRILVEEGLKEGDVIIKRTDTGRLKHGMKIKFKGFIEK